MSILSTLWDPQSEVAVLCCSCAVKTMPSQETGHGDDDSDVLIHGWCNRFARLRAVSKGVCWGRVVNRLIDRISIELSPRH